MKNNMKIFLCLVAVVVICFSIFFLVNRTKPTTTLTNKITKRLQKYSYFEAEPKMGFDEIMEKDSKKANWIYETFVNRCVKLSDNEKIFTSENLTYYSWNNHYVIRFVLQTKLDDGSIEEKDMEYEFSLSGWSEQELVSYGFRELGKKRIIKGSD